MMRSTLIPLLAGLWLLGPGCTTRITPPAGVGDPVSVFLLDHGRTCSLVLPAGEDGFVRYAYGDWQWYALGDTSLPSGLRALLWPTPGALGRRSFDGVPTAEAVRRQVLVPIDHLYEFSVERARAAALHAELNSLFEQDHRFPIEAPSAELEFVRHPRSYSLVYNSNHAATDWMRQLGCAVRGPTLISAWRISP